MSTPEGNVKRKISKLLKSFEPQLYYYMPVPGGFGAPSLDYIGAVNSHCFAIEAKAAGKKPTVRQDLTIARMGQAGINVFVVAGNDGFDALEAWIHLVGKSDE